MYAGRLEDKSSVVRKAALQLLAALLLYNPFGGELPEGRFEASLTEWKAKLQVTSNQPPILSHGCWNQAPIRGFPCALQTPVHNGPKGPNPVLQVGNLQLMPLLAPTASAAEDIS